MSWTGWLFQEPVAPVTLDDPVAYGNQGEFTLRSVVTLCWILIIIGTSVWLHGIDGISTGLQAVIFTAQIIAAGVSDHVLAALERDR